ncbi:MAG: hypothetical protein ACI9HE_000347 [Planctomycetota bacterium]|jgi:hypothetical protein
MKIHIPLPLLAIACLAVPLSAQATQLDDAERASVIEGIAREMAAGYVFPKVAEECSAHLRTELKAGKYDSMKSTGQFAQALTSAVQAISKDLHIRVRFEPNQERVERDDPRLARQQQLERMRASNFGFNQVEIMNGNVGYLDLRSFSDLQYARKTAASAMDFLSNADAIIVDLRLNGGGSPRMVQFLCSYFFEERTHLNSLYFRPTDTTEEFWTLEEIPGKRLPNIPLYVLTSNRTFSAAEEFSYNLSTRQRATLVGDTTGGGANPGGMVSVGEGFRMFIPSGRAINPITGTNWEGVGVVPNIPVSSGKALEVALKDARQAARDYRQFKAEELAFAWEEVDELIGSAEACFEEGNAETGSTQMQAALELGQDYELLTEGSINSMGQVYRQADSPAAALAVFLYNVDAYPQSANVWDSLGEGYVGVSNKQLAIASFEKSLALDPSNQHASDMIEELEQD